MKSKKDIATKNDIDMLVNKFYKQAKDDPILKSHFDLISDLEHHLPLIIDFWDGILLGASTYKGNPMLKHIQLNDKLKIKKEHMERWLSLWQDSILELFNGPVSELAYGRANQIGQLMLFKIQNKTNSLF